MENDYSIRISIQEVDDEGICGNTVLDIEIRRLNDLGEAISKAQAMIKREQKTIDRLTV